MRANRGFLVFVAALLLAAACSGDDEANTTSGPVTTTIARADSTTAAPSEPTTTAAGETTTTSGTDTTTTTVDESSSTTTEAPGGSTTTAAPAASSTTTTTGAPSPAVEARPASPGCPADLFTTTDDFGELSDSVIAAYVPPSGTPTWEIPLGYDYVVGMASEPNRLFALLASGTLIAIDIDDCGEAWRADVATGSTTVVGGVEVEDNILVVAASNKVLAFDTDSGNQLWSDTLSTPAQPPVLREGIAVVVGQTTPWIRSYWTDTGERLFNETAGFTGSIEAFDADFDAVYLAGGGKVEGRWIDDGAQLFNVPSQLNSAMVLFDIYVYVADGNRIAALDFDTGDEIWANQLDNRVVPPIGIGANHVLVFDETGRANLADFDTGVVSAGGSYGAFRVITEFDDSAFLVADNGTVTVYNVFEEAIFELPTGADGVSRFTRLEIAGGTVVTNTYSAERF